MGKEVIKRGKSERIVKPETELTRSGWGQGAHLPREGFARGTNGVVEVIVVVFIAGCHVHGIRSSLSMK